MAYTKQCFIGFLLLTTCALLAQCMLEPVSSLPTDQFADNPIEKDNDNTVTLHKRPAFFVGSRYGRSGGGASGSSKARRLIVVPRNDRFFLGSRYGKRSGEYTSPYEQSSLNGGQGQGQGQGQGVHFSGDNNSNKSIKSAYMSCTYTGIGNYYSCNNFDELDNIINQLSSTHNLGVEDDAAEMNDTN